MSTKDISKNKMLTINLIANLVAFASNLIINFFLSPYIVKVLGVEANGFVSLANNFVSYAALVSLALNSMSGRFITVSVHKNDMEMAKRYYTSVMLGNFALSLAFSIPAIMVLVQLQNIINIPTDLLADVKLLFAFMMLRFLVGNAFSAWGTAIFVKNKLYIQSLWNMVMQIFKVGMIVLLFYFLKPSVYYIGLVTFLVALSTLAFTRYQHLKLLPELKVRKMYFHWATLVELVSSGIWNTVTRGGLMLLSGLDLLIANLFIGSTEMGVLALSKTVPSLLSQLAGTITYVFVPSLTISYAKGDKEGLINELKKGMKLTSVVLTIPLAIVFVYGYEFYSLWVPTQDARLIQVLSILAIVGLIFTSGIQSLYSVFSVVNRLKVNSMLVLLTGALNVITVFILLKTTNLGIFAVAGVSSFYNLVRNMSFTVPFGAKYLGYKWYTFYPEVFISIISVIVSLVIGYSTKYFLDASTWFGFFVSACVMGLLTLLSNLFIVLSKDERQYFKDIIVKKIKGGVSE